MRVLGDDGGGSTDTVAKGVDYARTHGADVINLSLGSDVPLVGAMGGDAFDAAVHRALAAGIVVVAASGNNGVPVCEQPAAGDGLLCVGAVDKRKQRSFFSSFGSGLGLVAPGGSGTGVPGEDVLSTYKGSGYEELAGTSQAAPHVSGVAALLVARGVRGQAAVKRILATATDLGAPGDRPRVRRRAGQRARGGGGARRRHAGRRRRRADRGARPFVHVKKRQRARTVRRRGIRARVRVGPRAGRVRMRVKAHGHLIARGSKRRARRPRGDASSPGSPSAAAGWRARTRRSPPASASASRGEHRDRVRKIRIR